MGQAAPTTLSRAQASPSPSPSPGQQVQRAEALFRQQDGSHGRKLFPHQGYGEGRRVYGPSGGRLPACIQEVSGGGILKEGAVPSAWLAAMFSCRCCWLAARALVACDCLPVCAPLPPLTLHALEGGDRAQKCTRPSLQMISNLGCDPLVIQLPIGEEERFAGVIDLISNKALIWNGEVRWCACLLFLGRRELVRQQLLLINLAPRHCGPSWGPILV